jgi:hypothetical protein
MEDGMFPWLYHCLRFKFAHAPPEIVTKNDFLLQLPETDGVIPQLEKKR